MTNTDNPLDEILTAYGGKLERVAQHALQGVVYDEPNPSGKTLKQAKVIFWLVLDLVFVVLVATATVRVCERLLPSNKPSGYVLWSH